MELRSERLLVTVADEGIPGTRFDRTGVCTRVVLDGQHTFLGQEAHGDYAGTGGAGLCGEFGIETPLGYESSAVGGCFPKIGVGALTRIDAGAYDFMQAYPCRPFDLDVRQEERSITFVMTDCACGEYRFDYTKRLVVDDATLGIDYRLVNRGGRPIRTEEYCHNFMAIDDAEIDESYVLETSFPLRPEAGDPRCRIDGTTLRLSGLEQGYLDIVQDRGLPTDGAHWILRSPGHAGVSVTESFSLHRFELWSMTHAIAPEFFLWLDIPAGGEKQWRRTYRFFADEGGAP
jgi:hypothetical protein